MQCDGVDNRRAKSDAVPTLLERKRRDMEVKVVMTGTTVQGHDRRKHVESSGMEDNATPAIRTQHARIVESDRGLIGSTLAGSEC